MPGGDHTGVAPKVAAATAEYVQHTLTLADATQSYKAALAEHLRAVRAHARCQRSVRATARELSARTRDVVDGLALAVQATLTGDVGGADTHEVERI